MKPFIVAEISKNWPDPGMVQPGGFLAAQFEHVIRVNHQRGYRLHSFQLHRLWMGPDRMNETVIAVFESVGEG
jgi:hypothetical protein